MTPTTCPHCRADLRGDVIPEEMRSSYGGKERLTRAIGIYSRERDRTTHWKCPDCQREWRREDGKTK